MSMTISRRAPAAANYATKIGYVVEDHTVAGECVLNGASAAGEDSRPLGVIVEAENRLGGLCTICVLGPAFAIFGGVVTKGTHSIVKSDADSKLVAAADADATWNVGYVIFEGEETASADTEMHRIFVNPQLIEV